MTVTGGEVTVVGTVTVLKIVDVLVIVLRTVDVLVTVLVRVVTLPGAVLVVTRPGNVVTSTRRSVEAGSVTTDPFLVTTLGPIRLVRTLPLRVRTTVLVVPFCVMVDVFS